MSVDNSCSGSSSNQDGAGHLSEERPKLLEGIGSAAVSLTCYVLRKSRNLPYFVGPAVGALEDIVSPRFQPLAVKAGVEGMYLLSLVDEKLYALGEIAMEKVPFVSGFVSNAKGIHSMFEQVSSVSSYAYDQVCERGMVNGAANTWVKYEVTVKSKSADALKFVHKLPILGSFVPVIYTVGTPIASAISSWLFKHSGSQDKHRVFHEVRLLDDDDMDIKGDLEGKPLHVEGAEDSSRMAAQASSSEVIDSAESSESSSHPETVKKSELFEEVGEDKGKSAVMTVAPIHVDEDSDDDELSVLFHSGWSVGKIDPQSVRGGPKPRRKGWW